MGSSGDGTGALRPEQPQHPRRFRVHGLGSRVILAIFGAVLGLMGVGILGAVAAQIFGQIPPVQISSLAAGLVAAVLVAFRMQRIRPDVFVGTDGVRVGARFVSFAEIKEVSKTGVLVGKDRSIMSTRVGLRLRDGDPILLADFTNPFGQESPRATELAAAIEQARIAAPSTAEALAELLDPPDDDVARLRAFVADLAHKIGNYRDVALSREEIMRVASDAGTSPRRRIAAAMVYSHLVGAEGAPPIRLAAESVVNEPVRLALEQIAEGTVEDEVIERVLRA